MRVVMDACVLYPTVLREIVLGVAGKGLLEPLWSARLIGEWLRATRKLGPGAEAIAEGEAVVLAARWPRAMVPEVAGLTDGVSLPDPNDLHVVATARAGQADLILTLNLRDFPPRALMPFGIAALDPDRFLCGLLTEYGEAVAGVCSQVQREAQRLSGSAQPLRALLKRAGMPRLGKVLG